MAPRQIQGVQICEIPKMDELKASCIQLALAEGQGDQVSHSGNRMHMDLWCVSLKVQDHQCVGQKLVRLLKEGKTCNS